MSFRASPPELTEENLKKLQFTYSNDNSAEEENVNVGDSTPSTPKRKRKRKRNEKKRASPIKKQKRTTGTGSRSESESFPRIPSEPSSPLDGPRPNEQERDYEDAEGMRSAMPPRSRYKTAKQKKLKPATTPNKSIPKAKSRETPTKSKPAKRKVGNGDNASPAASPRERKSATKDKNKATSVSASFKAGAEVILKRAGHPLTAVEIVRIGLEEGMRTHFSNRQSLERFEANSLFCARPLFNHWQNTR